MNIVGRASYGRSPYWQDRDGRWTDRGCGRPPKPATYPTPTEPGYYRARYREGELWEIVRVVERDDHLVAWFTGNPINYELDEFFAWGPRIPDWRPEVPHA